MVLPRFRLLLRLVLSASVLGGCSSEDTSADADTCSPGFATQVVSVEYGAQAGFGQSSMPAVVLGPPKGAGREAGSLDVVSLGLQGTITLGFANDGIADGPGPDFIVFENAFFAGGDASSPFAEPASVSVSDDGGSWSSFPCDLATPPYDGCAGVHPVFSSPDNGISPFDPSQAGGDAYDLAGLALERVRFVKITSSSLVPTASGTSGFDLDAVVVLNPACR